MTIYFDDSLPRLCDLVHKYVGDECLSHSAIVRDAGGRLSVILPKRMNESRLAELNATIRTELAPYARPDGVLFDTGYPGAERLLEEASQQPSTRVGGYSVRLLDRRIVGSEWLRRSVTAAVKTPRIVFTSLKGGVGRSTTLCIVAAHLSRKGRRVLTVDFDLEAPGIGTMLLDEKELPPYGMLDYLVEAGISNVDENFITEMSGDSFLGASGARVTVIPAIGHRTLENPENALAKIARAYLESPQEDGSLKTMTDHLSDLLARYDALDAYDVVLIDGRSGLHETTASLVLGIGAEVLLFGLDQPQTFQGYRLLVGELNRHSPDASDDWLDRISFVHAKASDSIVEREEAASRFRGVVNSVLTDKSIQSSANIGLTEDDFDIDWSDSTDVDNDDVSDVQVLHVLEDTRYRQFDPVADRKILDSRAYTDTFGLLLEYLDSIAILSDPEEETEA